MHMEFRPISFVSTVLFSLAIGATLSPAAVAPDLGAAPGPDEIFEDRNLGPGEEIRGGDGGAVQPLFAPARRLSRRGGGAPRWAIGHRPANQARSTPPMIYRSPASQLCSRRGRANSKGGLATDGAHPANGAGPDSTDACRTRARVGICRRAFSGIGLDSVAPMARETGGRCDAMVPAGGPWASPVSSPARPSRPVPFAFVSTTYGRSLSNRWMGDLGRAWSCENYFWPGLELSGRRCAWSVIREEAGGPAFSDGLRWRRHYVAEYLDFLSPSAGVV